MSAFSASQDSRPEFVSGQTYTSVQNLTSGQRGSSEGISAGRTSRAGRDPLPPLRLTRRGRVVLIGIPLVLVAAFLLLMAGFLNAPAKAADSVEDLAVTPAVSVTVQSGESLWAIAAAVAPERDARDVIADIVQLNNLSAGTVLPGQQLYVPVK